LTSTPFPGPDDVPDRRIVAEHAFFAFDWREVEPGDADFAMEMEVTPRVVNSSGALQGGLLATLVDVVAGRALLETPGGYTRAATSELHLNFMEAARTGPVRAEARILRHGYRTAVVRVDVYDTGAGDRHVATATVSFTGRRE